MTIPGDVSSQFVSGLLLAAPLASDDVNIELTTRLESKPYVDMTLEIMRQHGIKADELENQFTVPAPQQYFPTDHLVPTDFSSTAFILVAGITCGDALDVLNVRESPIEPDSTVLELFSDIGAQMDRSKDRIRLQGTQIEGFSFDARDHPDLVPALEVLGCHASGRSEIRGVSRLVHKESDRLRSVPEQLARMGAKVSFDQDKVTIQGNNKLSGSILHSYHDHRVAMACSIASLGAEGPTTIEDAAVVSKSYPDFYEDLGRMGVEFSVE